MPHCPLSVPFHQRSIFIFILTRLSTERQFQMVYA